MIIGLKSQLELEPTRLRGRNQVCCIGKRERKQAAWERGDENERERVNLKETKVVLPLGGIVGLKPEFASD